MMGHPNCRCVVLPMPGAWPVSVRVTPPVMRGRQRDAQVGTEEGDTCFRDYGDGRGWCQGHLELRRDDDLGGCSCFAFAPCSSCMSQVPECDTCGHREPEPC